MNELAQKAEGSFLNQDTRDDQKVVVVSAGGANFGRGNEQTHNDIAKEYCKMLRDVKDLFPNAKICAFSILPRRQPLSSEINRQIKATNATLSVKTNGWKDIEFIDCWNVFCSKEFKVVPDFFKDVSDSDDVHLSLKGKGTLGRLWVDAILKSLNE